MPCTIDMIVLYCVLQLRPGGNVPNLFIPNKNYPVGFRFVQNLSDDMQLMVSGHCPKQAGDPTQLSSKVWTARFTISDSTGVEAYLSRQGGWLVDRNGLLAIPSADDEDAHIPLALPAQKATSFRPGCRPL